MPIIVGFDGKDEIDSSNSWSELITLLIHENRLIIPSPIFVGEGDIAFGLSVRPSSLLLQRDKGLDFKTYADLLLTYCIVLHLVFSLSENPFIWSNFRSKLRRFWAHKGLMYEFLCVLLLQGDKVMDSKSDADLLLIYVVLHLVFSLWKSIYLVKFEVKT